VSSLAQAVGLARQKSKGERERARRQREPAASARGPHRDRNAHSYTRSYPPRRYRPMGSRKVGPNVRDTDGFEKSERRYGTLRGVAFSRRTKLRPPSVPTVGPGGAHGPVGTACQRGPSVAALRSGPVRIAWETPGVGRWSPHHPTAVAVSILIRAR
jgi:hypothetical protein